jgi:type II secretory pathway pseudopilin PulG
MASIATAGKSKIRVIVLILILLLAGGGAFLYQNNRQKQQNLKQAEAVVKSAIKALKAQDFEKIMALAAIPKDQQAAALEGLKKQSAAQKAELDKTQILAIGPAVYVPKESGKIIVPVTIMIEGHKITNRTLVVYDKVSRRWLLSPNQQG